MMTSNSFRSGLASCFADNSIKQSIISCKFFIFIPLLINSCIYTQNQKFSLPLSLTPPKFYSHITTIRKCLPCTLFPQACPIVVKMVSCGRDHSPTTRTHRVMFVLSIMPPFSEHLLLKELLIHGSGNFHHVGRIDE